MIILFSNLVAPFRIWFVAMVLVVISSQVQAYQDGSWLYQIDVPVASQNAADRKAAASTGLLSVLSRVSGLSSVPRNAEIAQALADPQRYYTAYNYHSKNQSKGREKQMLARFSFQRDAVVALANAAQLPLWWEARPEVVVWLAVEQEGRRTLLNASSDHPLVQQVLSYAQRRGLPVKFPILDLTDQLAVSTSDVWGRTTAIDEASVRYDADISLVGRFRQETAGSEPKFSGDWEFWFAEQPLTVPVNSQTVAASAASGLEAMAELLTSRYAVLPRGLQTTTLQVADIDSAQSYAQLIRYLGTFEFLQNLQVESVYDGAVYLSLQTHAKPEQLALLLTAQARLLNVESFVAFDGLALRWSG